MKKWSFLFILILVIGVYGCTTTEIDKTKYIQEENGQNDIKEQTTDKIEEQPEAEIRNNDSEQPTKEKPEATAEKKIEFQIFNPVLTYEGAYNGPLYGTSEQIGATSMDSYFNNLDRNGINFFIGMFPIFGEPQKDSLVSHQGLGYVIDAAQKHPHRIIPFFNPGIGGEGVEKYLGVTLTGWYKKTLVTSNNLAGKGFIRGFGEVETQEWDASHNDQRVLQLTSIAQENKINFMFHPVAAKINDVEKIIEAYPDTTFLIHMYREDLDNSMTKLIKILQEYDNLYFSIDAAHILFVDSLGGDLVYIYDSKDKQESINKFVSTYNREEESMINDAIKAYKPLVDAVPDKVMWGTEIGPEYAFDPKVFDRAVKISRFVIAGFSKEHQEAVGYKNALRVFGEGVTADPNIKVIDTKLWSECTKEQIDECDKKCESPDSVDTGLPDEDDCLVKCTITLQCREVPEMDTG